jgi:hypothetical protein
MGTHAQHLASVLALLMLLAFLVDQIPQRCSAVFRQVWRGLGTKAKVWERCRSWFRVLKFPSRDSLDRHLAFLYGLQLE